MPNPSNEYICPRCMYSTTLKYRMVQHFEKLKKPCPPRVLIELTPEIKEYVLLNFIYVKPEPQQTTLNNPKPTPSKPVSRKNIPQALRKKVWLQYIGNNLEGKCFCCEYNKIDPFNFHCGHVIAHHNGGPITLENLRAICDNCNRSMGTRNMFEFKAILSINGTPMNDTDTSKVVHVLQ